MIVDLTKRIFVVFLIVFIQDLYAQVSGTVMGEDGEILPYASVYIKNTSKGTSTNLDGDYSLRLDPGQYELVFQYVGYRTFTEGIELTGQPMILNVVLQAESQLLQEVVVSADAEDPAYAIIRKAMAKREYYKNLFDSYRCDVYVKGNNKILDAPEKILGFEVGDLEGLLDSNRQGIVYLSESVSELYYQSPGEYKEVVTSSKISGNDQGYSFNSAREMEFNFYENTLELNRKLVSPIGRNAMSYYRYKLLGKFLDEENRLISKIDVIPKRETDPVFYGTIYITEDLWNIHSLTLGATAKSTQLYFVDSLTFSQVFIPLQAPDKWGLFNNTISFKMSGFGFVFAGFFTAVYSEYDLDPDFDNNLFNNEVHVVQAESNKKDSTFWASIRPMPLAEEEIRDYSHKDSIQAIKDDPMYIDSVDRANSKFKWGNLLGGYSYQKRNRQLYWSISSPIGAVGFNTVQGFNGDLSIDYRKYFDEEETRRILLYTNMNYGFSENKFRMNGSAVYRGTRMNANQISFAGGTTISQFNSENPISRPYNTLYSLLSKKNYAKYYDRSFVSLGWVQDLATGLRLTGNVKWEKRQPLSNSSDYSFFNREEVYTSNDPLDPDNYQNASFEVHEAILLDLRFRIRFGQRYIVYPHQRFSAGHKGPGINLSYSAALDWGGADISFQKLALSLSDQVSAGATGEFEYYGNFGVFFSKGAMEFMDYRHFLGTQTVFLPEENYNRRFLLLPYYLLSTNQEYFQLHLSHNFNGYFLDRIPAIRALGFGLVAGAKYLHSGPNPEYFELHAGLDKIGYKVLRLFRVDAVFSSLGGQTDWGVRIGIKIN